MQVSDPEIQVAKQRDHELQFSGNRNFNSKNFLLQRIGIGPNLLTQATFEFHLMVGDLFFPNDLRYMAVIRTVYLNSFSQKYCPVSKKFKL